MAESDIAETSDVAGISQYLRIQDRDGRPGSQGGSGKGRERGKEIRSRGGRGGGGGRGEMNREVAVSKALSKLLRHAAGDAGLELDKEGFARVDQVMKWPRLKSLQVTFDDIRTAVADNAKQRFSMKPNQALSEPPDGSSEEPSDWVIRANQGHSIAIDSAALLVPITLEAGNVPDIVVHGTYFAFYPSIVKTGGLKKMTRNHIHFSTGLPEDKQGVISGMRSDAEILVYVDIKKSLEDGVVLWWISDNGVVLTEGDSNGILATKYWKTVVGRRQDVGVLWEDGKQVGELPQSLANRKPPAGKGLRGKGGSEKATRKDTDRGTVKGRAKGMKELDALGGEEGLGMNEP